MPRSRFDACLRWKPRSLDQFLRLRQEWFGNIRGDLLAGTAVALALIPEAIAF